MVESLRAELRAAQAEISRLQLAAQTAAMAASAAASTDSMLRLSLDREVQYRKMAEAHASSLIEAMAQMQAETANRIQRAAAVLQQVAHYFSPANLRVDTYLHSLMEPETSYVTLEAISRFPRMQYLCVTAEELATLLQWSAVVELSSDGSAVRAKSGGGSTLTSGRSTPCSNAA